MCVKVPIAPNNTKEMSARYHLHWYDHSSPGHIYDLWTCELGRYVILFSFDNLPFKRPRLYHRYHRHRLTITTMQYMYTYIYIYIVYVCIYIYIYIYMYTYRYIHT